MRRGAFLLALASGLGAQQFTAGEPTAERLPSAYRNRHSGRHKSTLAALADPATSVRAGISRAVESDDPASSNPGWWQRHLGDTIAHGAATTADIASSRGLVEVNPILRDSRGQLGARGISIKLGIFAAVELAKWRIARRHPQDRWVRALSLAPAALYVGAASHNWRIR